MVADLDTKFFLDLDWMVNSNRIFCLVVISDVLSVPFDYHMPWIENNVAEVGGDRPLTIHPHQDGTQIISKTTM